MHQQSSCDYSSQEALCCFFFLSCLTNIYVFLYKKEKETVSSCLSLVDIFLYKYYKTTSLIPVFFLLFCFVVLHGHRLRMILFVFLFFFNSLHFLHAHFPLRSGRVFVEDGLAVAFRSYKTETRSTPVDMHHMG